MNFDCFGLQNLSGNYSCKALKKLDCDDCNFFKTKRQVELEDKYYGNLTKKEPTSSPAE